MIRKKSKYIIAIALTVLIILITLSGAYLVGNVLDCQLTAGTPGAFCAIRTRTGAGASVQLAGGLSVWSWGPGGQDNQRWWPVE